jgi:hypothetical protein
MMKERELSTTIDTLDDLWIALDKLRSTSKSVTVKREALAALLIDHSKMASELFSAKYKRAA